MATAQEYAKWIVDNQDQQGSPEFETVAKAYQIAKGQGGNSATPQSQPAASGAEVIAGLAPTRFALGVAEPALATMQAAAKLPVIPGPLGMFSLLSRAVAPSIEQTQNMVEAGRKEIGSDGIDWARLGGNVMSPVALGAAKIPMATGLGARTAQGAKVGAALGAGTLVDPSEQNFAAKKVEQAGAGMAAGGAASAVLPPVINAVAKVAGGIWDMLIGKYGVNRASKIAKGAAGGDVAAIKAASAAAPELTAPQAAAGLDNDVWNALGELAKKNDTSGYWTRLLKRQQEERAAAIRSLAGGATQTEVLQATEASKKSLQNVTTPMRETELGAANEAGKQLPRLAGQAENLSQAASGRVEDVRRLSNAQQIAEDLANSGAMRLGRDMVPPVAGLPRASGRFAYGTELANIAEKEAGGAAADSLILGEAGRFAQRQADSLAAHGLKPLDTGTIVKSLIGKINDPKIGPEDLNRRVLSRVAMKIAQWTEKGGGTIDANALYQIRQSAVNNEVDRLLASADPAVKAKRAAQLLTEVKPLIDDAIEKAGGTGWRDYLKTFERGMRTVNQQQMAGKALDMLETDPSKFTSLVRGNEPREVEKVFGAKYDFEAAMGNKKYGTFRGVAEQLERDKSILEGAARGQGGLQRVLDEHGINFILPNWIDREIAITNRVIRAIESKLKKSTVEALYEGMKTGKGAAELLNAIPTEERIKAVQALVPYARTAAAISGTQ